MFPKRIQENEVKGKVLDQSLARKELIHDSAIEYQCWLLKCMTKVGCEAIFRVFIF